MKIASQLPFDLSIEQFRATAWLQHERHAAPTMRMNWSIEETYEPGRFSGDLSILLLVSDETVQACRLRLASWLVERGWHLNVRNWHPIAPQDPAPR